MAQAVWLPVDQAQLILQAAGRTEATLVENRAIGDAVAAQDATLTRHAKRHHLRASMTCLEPLVREHPELFSQS